MRGSCGLFCFGWLLLLSGNILQAQDSPPMLAPSPPAAPAVNSAPSDQPEIVETAPFKPLDQLPLNNPDALPSTRRPTDLSEAELPANARVADARDKFALFQIDESSYRRVLQGVPLGEQDFEVLLDLLYRLPVFDNDMLAAIVQKAPAWKEFDERTTNYVGGVFEINGTLRQFKNLSPPSFDAAAPATPRPPAKNNDEVLARMAERKTVQNVYRCLIDVAGLERAIEVYALHVPNAWKKTPTIGDRVGFRGVLLKAGGGEGTPAFYFVAPRVMWYPNTLLGRLGLDHGLLDALAQRATILQREQEVFYEFMAAAARYPQEDYMRVPLSNDRLLELWQQPERYVGELESFQGIAHNVDKIMIEDPERVKHLGFDHYYYMELFVPPMTKSGKDATVKLKIKVPVLDSAGEPTGAETEEAMHFDTLPVVYYFRELPPGETTETLKHRGVRATGFFFKAWRYQSNYALKNKEHAMLIGPLVMGRSPVPDSPELPPASTTWPAFIVLGVIGSALLVGMYFLAVQKREAAKRFGNLPDKISVEL